MLDASEIPLILEVRGGGICVLFNFEFMRTFVICVILSIDLPENVISIVQVSNNIKSRHAPSIDAVLEVLINHGVQPRSHIISSDYKQVKADVESFLQKQPTPVVIIHYEGAHLQRSLASSNSTSLPTPLTEFQISQYQVSNVTDNIGTSLSLSLLTDIYFLDMLMDRSGNVSANFSSYLFYCEHGGCPR